MKRRSTSEMEPRKSEHNAPLMEQDRSSHDDIELSNLEAEIDGAPLLPSYEETPMPAVPKTKSSYIAIAVALLVIVVGFTVNTESTAYIEDVLGWRKPFCTMYLTHSALALPWFCHLGYSRFKERKLPYTKWVRSYNDQIREVASTIDAYVYTGPKMVFKWKGQAAGPLDYLASSMIPVTVALTISGGSWFVALAMTTPGDLTAIYNCSTFFAAAFAVPILKERLGWIAIAAIALSIAGTFVVAYGDTTAEHEESAIGTSRLFGNLVACIGAVGFGLYEVLFKKFACSSKPMEPSASLPLTFAASALTGIYTFATLWVGLIILHLTGVETFVWPSVKVGLWLVLAVLSGSISVNMLVVLVVWTDPVFGSMANVMSVMFVALADWVVFNLKPSLVTCIGGVMIVVAFGMLAKDTLEVKQH